MTLANTIGPLNLNHAIGYINSHARQLTPDDAAVAENLLELVALLDREVVIRAELLAALEAAMRIETLWGPSPNAGPEHESEMSALASMRDMFVAAIQKARPA